jgi:hypothetical protein
MDKNMKRAEQQLSNMGYVHPENDNRNVATYSNYNEIGDPYTLGTYDTYSKYNEIETVSNNLDTCPQCNNKVLFICECDEYKDRMCKNKHMWYIDKKGKIVMGDPHMNEDL